jgi:hypothetical protein
MSIKNNTDSLQELLQALGGKTVNSSLSSSLPTLESVGKSSDLLEGKQLIDGNGNIVTGRIHSQAEKIISPATDDQIITLNGVYTTGNIIVEGDHNLVPNNIKRGKYIFGVRGAYVTSSDVKTKLWTFTLEDGSEVEKELVRYYNITYDLEEGIVVDNPIMSLRSGEPIQISFTNTANELMTFDSNWGYYFTIKSGEVITIDDEFDSTDLHIRVSYGAAWEDEEDWDED